MLKNGLYGMLLVGLLFLAPQAVAYNGTYTPGTGINGTVHDLGTAHNGMNYTAVTVPPDTLNRICIFCHAPHNTYKPSGVLIGGGPNAPSGFDYLPLWNHNLTGFTTVFIPYTNGTGGPQTGPKASQAIINGMTIGSSSLLCLSCHDGTIAVNSFGNSSQLSSSVSTGSTFISNQYQIGKDKYLGNHHPIGFDYDLVAAIDNEIRNSSTPITPTSLVSDHLSNSKMECATCHSVHNKGNAGERLLWRSDQNSELCLTCHDKGVYTAP
jgi:predicted CXXCH cytochrome family protein